MVYSIRVIFDYEFKSLFGISHWDLTYDAMIAES